ncbi:unnamed protein product [Ceratitis capitata]|uniref:(Mediterranean fruit fly) hypothetical protein n=1 Tax=Ceratitis capitata TaxID=7213 RepID=A0A811UX63_CERCA|nr:unnamed protein product [Ceratitis capitata]
MFAVDLIITFEHWMYVPKTGLSLAHLSRCAFFLISTLSSQDSITKNKTKLPFVSGKNYISIQLPLILSVLFFDLFVPENDDKNGRTLGPLCHKYHPLRMCGAFRAMKPPQRLAVARAQIYCINCLPLTHTTGECDSSSSCKRCHKAHHTLMQQDAAVRRKPAANAAHQVVARKKSAAFSRAS